jgi:hypothetical protein
MEMNYPYLQKIVGTKMDTGDIRTLFALEEYPTTTQKLVILPIGLYLQNILKYAQNHNGIGR